MEDTTPAEVLLRLLNACDASEDRAIRLARRTETRELKVFLQQSARDYRSAADDLRATLTDVGCDPGVTAARMHNAVDAPAAEDVAASWECAEGEALAHFRDAFDSDLPSSLAKVVKRHYEMGIARLERLRELQAHLY